MPPDAVLPTWAWVSALGALASVVGILFKMVNGHAAARIADKDSAITRLDKQIERGLTREEVLRTLVISQQATIRAHAEGRR